METHVSAKGFQLKNELEKYANRKLARVRRRIPRKLRVAAGCEVVFTQVTRHGAKSCTCTIMLTLDNTRLTAKETTAHMYAALDIAAVHIEQQLKMYKHARHKGLLGRRLHTL